MPKAESRAEAGGFHAPDKNKKEIAVTLFTRKCTATGSGSVDIIRRQAILATKILHPNVDSS